MISAHIEKNVNDFAKTYNKSSQIVHDSIVESAVTLFDVNHMKDELKHFCGSFIETFSGR